MAGMLERQGHPRSRPPSGARVVRLAAALLASMALGACDGGSDAPPEPDPEPQAGRDYPNVLVVMADDQPHGTVARMPFLSSRDDFIDLRELHTNNAWCCPSRATFLTGQYSHHTGVETVADGERLDDTNTLATWFDDAGYDTALFGKYLNRYPFDGGPGEAPPGWDRWLAFRGEPDYFGYELTDGEEVIEPDEYATDHLVAQTAAFVASAEEPFFAFLAPNTPHTPLVPAPRHEGLYSPSQAKLPPNLNRVSSPVRFWQKLEPYRPEREQRATTVRWEMLRSLDEGVEELFEVLRKRGVLDDTIVLYTSDNGLSLGSHRWGQKACMYEECTHVPALIRRPGTPSAQTVDQVTSNVDLAPTLADLAGVRHPPTDGRSLEEALRTGRLEPRPVLLRHRKGGDSTPPTAWGVRTDRWKLISTRGTPELYDLRADPYELEDLATRPGHEHVVERLQRQIARLRGER